MSFQAALLITTVAAVLAASWLYGQWLVAKARAAYLNGAMNGALSIADSARHAERAAISELERAFKREAGSISDTMSTFSRFDDTTFSMDRHSRGFDVIRIDLAPLAIVVQGGRSLRVSDHVLRKACMEIADARGKQIYAEASRLIKTDSMPRRRASGLSAMDALFEPTRRWP